MRKVKVAVVGAGNWGRNHIRTLAALPDAELAVVCDSDPERRAHIVNEYPSVRVTDSLDGALEGIDGVVVATPVPSHAEVARECLKRGLPTLIEKPVALSTNDAEDLVKLSGMYDAPVLAGHLLVFHSAVEFLKRMIADGELGSIYYLYSQRVNLGEIRRDENALWSFGPHDVSVAMELLGDVPVEVAAHGKSFLQPDIEDVVFLTMEMSSGAMVHVQMSWLDPHKERRLTVVGSRKMVVFDDMQPREKIKVYDKGVRQRPAYGSYAESLAVREGDIWVPRIASVEPLRAELAHFVQVIRGHEIPRASARDGLNVVRVLEAATESLKTGGSVVEVAPASSSIS